MSKIRVLIVDDSALMRRLLSDLLSGEEDIEIVGTAADPYDAREKIKQFNPHVVTLDIEMPRMDGLSFLEKIMQLRPMPVIMVSTLTTERAAETLRALEMGAVDCIAKPQQRGGAGLEQMRHMLADKIRAAAAANLRPLTMRATGIAAVASYVPPSSPVELIAIGASTGGVEALRHILAQLPPNLPPVMVTQHMPAGFTASFATRLDGLSALSVAEAADGGQLLAGHAYIAPGGRHLSVARRGGQLVAKLGNGDPVSGHKPSVDVLLSSVAQTAGRRALGVMLTGMGRDGAAGMLAMRTSGAFNIAQDRDSCVVYGMPRAAVELGAAHAECALSGMAAAIVDYCNHPYQHTRKEEKHGG